MTYVGYNLSMDEDEKELIRTRTDIVELISSYTALKRTGSKYKGLCPFHGEKTPSFNVDPERGRWHCFGACSMGGDVFTFLEKIENLSFMEAAERLAERAGITLRGRGDSEEAKKLKSERERLYSANAAAMNFFRQAFERAKLAQEYATRRGLVYETREAFAIGYAPDDWEQLARYLIQQKIHPEDAVKAGLISPSRRGDGSYIDRFRGRLMFPIVDVQERVVGFGGRLIVDQPGSPKYLNSPETPVFSKSKILYALNRGKRAITEKHLAVIVEGYMDAVAAHQAGIPHVVATLGTALTEEHARLLRRYVGEKGSVALSFDADKAGVNAALKAAELISATGTELDLRVLALPPGEDPDSLIAKGNVAAFHKAIDDALTVPEFRLRSLENQHNLENESGRMAYLREAVEIIAAIPSLLEQDRLVRLIAAQHPSFSSNSLRVEEMIRAEVSQVANRTRTAPAPAREREYEEPPAYDDGTYLNPTPPQNYQNRRPGNQGSRYPNRDGGYGNKGNYGNNGRQSGQNQYGNNNGQRRWVARPDDASYRPPEPPPQVAWNATTTAERTLVRALLSPEWVRSLIQRFATPADFPPFASRTVQRLFDTLWPLVSGRVSPTDALAQLSEPELSAFADTVLMAEGEPELSEDVIEDAVRQLKIRVLQAKNAEIRASVSQKEEGMPATDDETLRRWALNAKTLRGKGGRENPNSDG